MSGMPLQPARALELPEGMYRRCAPVPAPDPDLLYLNTGLLAELGVDPTWFAGPDGLAVMAGHPVDGLDPVAMAYAGHQFGGFVPQLGDGRAHLLGELVGANSRVEVQAKGSGPTPFSRGGDGFATLGAALREVLVSEAMAGLGIPTTRALAVVATGATVKREVAYPGAVVVRTAASHLRVGSVQFAAAHLGADAVAALADHLVEHHFTAVDGNRLRLLEAIVARQADLVAEWLLVGFIHGVMNTDNLSLVGETIDYGPCAFMDRFDPMQVFSSIDQYGRYAWARQPGIAHWNLTRLAEALAPALDADTATLQGVLDTFEPRLEAIFRSGMQRKLGVGVDADGDAFGDFSQATLRALTDAGIDWTLAFHALTGIAGGAADDTLLDLADDSAPLQAWLADWRALRERHPADPATMARANPVLIARNHRVNQAIAAAEEHGDLAPFERLCAALANPFEVAPGHRDLLDPPQPDEVVTRTFCGT